ncbi:MAG: glucodextranase DOMON-like domain-containing protein [Elusimicrobiota bacterium]
MRRRRLAWGLALGLSLAAAPASAFLWFGRPAKAGLLWIPAESFSDWEGLAEALSRHPKLSFTAALTPSMASPGTRSLLQPFVAEGRLEIALRLDGDPILPLIHDHPTAPRPQDPLELLTAGRAAHRLAWGEVPTGFVPASGLLHPGLLPLLRSLDPAWVASGGAGPKAGPWTEHRGMPIARCRPVRTGGRDLLAADLEGGTTERELVVIDEAGGDVPEGSWPRLLLVDHRARGLAKRFERVRDSLSRLPDRGAPEAPAGGPWTDWTGEEDAWSRRPEQKIAWRLYGDAARAVSEARNAGAGPRSVAAATASLRSAQAGTLYRRLGGALPEKSSEADRELRKRLMGVYKALSVPVPEGLLVSVLTSARTPGRSFDAGGAVSCRQGPNWLSCDNPSLAPPVREDPRWRIAGFRVQWDDESVVLVYRLGRVVASTTAACGFDGVLLAAYVDLNGVRGAGSTRLLETADADSISPEDAWESAVTAGGWGFALHRATARGQPVIELRGAATADPSSSEVSVRLPRSKLRGNPALWGWTVTAAEPGPGGAALRGALADRVFQRRLRSRRPNAAADLKPSLSDGLRLRAIRPPRP